MRALIQRVSSASVTINGKISGAIDHGVLIFLGIEDRDGIQDIEWLGSKIARMRIFPDEHGLMNLSLHDNGGSVLVVSQFTLHALVKKGNRPSFTRAARPEHAEPLYREFITALEKLLGKPCQSGEFGADMQVQLINEGPVTIFIDSHDRQ